jgi:NADPH2:quinone reductase
MSGLVKEVGEGVKGYKPGDRVIAFTTYGAFAEEVKVEASRLVPIPEGMDFNSAAAFLLTYGTSDHALRDRGALRAGETLLVLGAAGGVGLAAIDIGKALGARVIACASTEEKLAVCRSHGADAGINYATEDLRERIKALTEGRGVDVVYDAVGGPYSEPAFRSLAWRGRLLVVGFAAGDIPKLPLNLALLKGASVVGVFWGDFARREPKAFAESVRQLGQWYREGKLRPHVSQTFPLEKTAEALKLMAARQVKGKVVITVA